MSNHKHNYSQYSNKNNNQNQRPTNQTKRDDRPRAISQEEVEKKYTPVIPAEPIKPVIETVETVTLPETVEGMVVNCAKLNVREEPTVDSGIVCVLTVQSEIQIDVAKTTKDWVYVYTATGLEGYCMRQYIEAHM